MAEGIAIRGVQTTDGGFLIDTESEATQDALLAMDGRVLEGKAVKAARTQVKMTGTEILAWVEEKLKVQQEAKELSFQGDSQPYPQLFHQAQEMGPTEQAYGFQLMRPSPPNTLTVHMAKQTEVIGEQNSENQPPTRFQPDGWKGGRGRGGKGSYFMPSSSSTSQPNQRPPEFFNNQPQSGKGNAKGGGVIPAAQRPFDNKGEKGGRKGEKGEKGKGDGSKIRRR